MTVYRVEWQRRDGSWLIEDEVFTTRERARQRGAYIAQSIDVPVRLISDWDHSVVETLEPQSDEPEQE